MDKEILYLLEVFIGLYLINYGPPQRLVFFLSQFYNKSIQYLNYYNYLLSPEYFTKPNIEEDKNNLEPINVFKPEKKYEDKYLAEIRKLNKDFIFNDEEEAAKLKKYLDFLNISNESKTTKINEINEKLNYIENKLSKYDTYDYDDCCCDKNEDGENEDEDEDANLGETKEERIQTLQTEKEKLVIELNNLKRFDTKEGQEELMKQSNEESEKFIINQRLEKLKNCFVMESTPLGNVLMIYDTDRGSFKYYSDNTIPYRYLEVVGRKYVKQFDCRPIFVDMEEELTLAEEKWEHEKKEKEEKEQEEKKRKEELSKNLVVVEEKKNVFAKFKQYNKTAGTGHVISAAPPKNSIPNKSITEKCKILLKDKANRYTYEGKLANFSFLKKVDRKIVNKKFAITFADFKKMNKNK